MVPHHLHYTTLAERDFEGLEVYNIGVVDTGPAEYRSMLELHALPLQPQLVVVALFVGNDIGDARRNRLGLRAAWMDRDEVLVLQAPLRLLRLYGERRAGDHRVQHGFSIASRDRGEPGRRQAGLCGRTKRSPEVRNVG